MIAFALIIVHLNCFFDMQGVISIQQRSSAWSIKCLCISDTNFGQHIIRFDGSALWKPCSPVLTPMDFDFESYMKTQVYLTESTSLVYRKQHITTYLIHSYTCYAPGRPRLGIYTHSVKNRRQWEKFWTASLIVSNINHVFIF